MCLFFQGRSSPIGKGFWSEILLLFDGNARRGNWGRPRRTTCHFGNVFYFWWGWSMSIDLQQADPNPPWCSPCLSSILHKQAGTLRWRYIFFKTWKNIKEEIFFTSFLDISFDDITGPISIQLGILNAKLAFNNIDIFTHIFHSAQPQIQANQRSVYNFIYFLSLLHF